MPPRTESILLSRLRFFKTSRQPTSSSPLPPSPRFVAHTPSLPPCDFPRIMSNRFNTTFTKTHCRGCPDGCGEFIDDGDDLCSTCGHPEHYHRSQTANVQQGTSSSCIPRARSRHELTSQCWFFFSCSMKRSRTLKPFRPRRLEERVSSTPPNSILHHLASIPSCHRSHLFPFLAIRLSFCTLVFVTCRSCARCSTSSRSFRSGSVSTSARRSPPG